jgi:hypothetical protein
MILLGCDVSRPSFPLLLHGATGLELIWGGERPKSFVFSIVNDESKIFHLRGAIDYTGLSLKHRIMMKLLYSKVTTIPEAERNAEVRALIATYGKQVDFVNFDTLKPIAQILK